MSFSVADLPSKVHWIVKNKKADEGIFVRFYYSSILYLSSSTAITATAIPASIIAASTVTATAVAAATGLARTIFGARFLCGPTFEHSLA
jgi:hypothetical protein